MGVRWVDAQAKPEWNGLRGLVCSMTPTGDRYAIQLHSDAKLPKAEAGKKHSIKPDNLTILDNRSLGPTPAVL
jgi:hypothetical protein